MMWRDGEVVEVRRTWGAPGRRCTEVGLRVCGAPANADSFLPGDELRAVAYEAITGLPEVGERVRAEISALDRALGTGGHAMVCSRPDVLPDDPPRGGHLVKARYMPDQVMVTGVDEQGTAHHAALTGRLEDLGIDGMPVVVADLHSSLPAILAGVRAGSVGPGALRAVYVMTDGGALPLAYSRAAAALAEAGWLTATVTAGQAWGGDVEAVSVHNALLAARRVLGADLVVLTQGPGNLGTDTPWGFSGVACGEAINAVGVLGGRPVACLRISQADARERHRGVSHHSTTAYGRVATVPADVVVPELPGELGRRVDAQARALCGAERPGHRRVDVGVDGLMEALRACQEETVVRLSTMGRGLDRDAAAFLAAAAAGRYAASLVRS